MRSAADPYLASISPPHRLWPGLPARLTLARRPWCHHSRRPNVLKHKHWKEEDRVDNPAGYLHLGFIVISWPNLALIASMVVLFVIAVVAPFPGEGGRRG